MQPARFLKILVIALGFAIFVALGFVIYGVMRLGTGADSETRAAPAPSSMPTVSDLGQPAGTEITGMTLSGGGRLVLSLTGGELPDRVVMMDLKSGQIAATTYVSPLKSNSPP
jgi:hypothetical protein